MSEEVKFLDEILYHLLDVPNHKGKEFYEFDFQKKHYSIDREYIKSAVNKLIKDGYVHSLVPENNVIINARIAGMYYLTFEGMFFIKNGGYEAQKLSDYNLSVKTLKEEKQTRFYNRVILAGTVIASIYALFQILKELGAFSETVSKTIIISK